MKKNNKAWAWDAAGVNALESNLGIGAVKGITGPVLLGKLQAHLGEGSQDTRLRRLRVLVEIAHTIGIPVAGGNSGYYLAEYPAELEDYAARLEVQASGLAEKAALVRTLQPAQLKEAA